MSLDIKLTNKNLINYTRTDDAFEAFAQSAENGQTRLAVEVLAELISGIMDEIDQIKEMLQDSSVDDLDNLAVIDDSLFPAIEQSVAPVDDDEVIPVQKTKSKPIKNLDENSLDTDTPIEQ